MNNPTAVWQRQLAEAFNNVYDLCRYLQIEPASLPLLTEFKDFPLRVPRGFAACMQKGNPQDPLLRQVLPLQDELMHFPGYSHDPVGDLAAITETGVIHKYRRRVLLITTGGCAVHCRYCFRRHFPYAEVQLSGQRMRQALAYIASRSEIDEVILSGGDPLLLSDEKIAALLQSLSEMTHIRRIRIHSRIPVVLPDRMTESLLQILSAPRQPVILVLHANHGNELSPAVSGACTRLKQNHITLLNQSVLLRDVNDDETSLTQLSEKLFDLGILPYYLHCLDRAVGVGHFEVTEAHAQALLQSLERNLPGYLVPKLVKEQAGALHKIRIA